MESRAISIEELLSHQAWLRRLAGGLVRGADADDVVQETWLAATRRPPREGGSRKGWLATVARNAANQLRRGERSRRRREHAVARADVDADSARIAERVEMQRRVAREVLALEEPWRTVVLLRYFEDLSSSEIARRLGVPSSTVRNRQRRALEILRTRLDERSGGDRRRWVLPLAPLLAPKRDTFAAVAALWSVPVAAFVVLLMVTITGLYVLLPASGAQAPPDWEEANGGELGDRDPAADREGAESAVAAAGAPVFARAAGRSPSLEGTVTFARGGAPCAGARVVAALPDGPWGKFQPGAAYTTETDGEGRYALFDLPHGLYTVSAQPEEAPTARRRDVWIGTDAATVDLRIRPAVRLFGRVTAADTGEPVPGVRLTVRESPHLTGVTDREGRYEIRGFPRGTRFPSVGLSRGGILSVIPPYDSEFYIPGRVQHGLKVCCDPGGGDVRFDIRLERGGTVTGRVLGPDGRGMAGVRITEDILTDQDYRPGATALSKADGSFRLPGLEPRCQKLCARKDGYPVMETLTPMVAAGGVTGGVVIRLCRGGRVSGRLVGEDGGPAAGVLIFYRQKARRNEEVHGLNPDPQVTDEDGAFRFTGVPAGAAWLEICAGRYMAATFDGIDLDEGGVLDDLSITLRRGLTLTGRVVREHGSPVVGARVRIDPGFEPASLGLLNRVVVDAFLRTDGEGRFRATGLPEGPYRIRVSGLPPIEWRPGDGEPVFRMGEVTTLRGCVAADASGRPPEYFEVRCLRIDPPGSGAGPVPGNADGTFEIPGLAPGVYRVTAADGQGRTGTAIGASGDAVRVLMVPGGLARGTVFDLSGRPARAGHIKLRRNGDEWNARSGSVSETGGWAVGPLDPGTWEVLVRSGRGEARATLEVTAGETLNKDLRVDCGRALSVLVFDGRGCPVRWVEVELTDPRGEKVRIERKKRLTDWSGHKVFHDLAPGEYVVTVEGESVRATVNEDHCVRVRLTLGRD